MWTVALWCMTCAAIWSFAAQAAAEPTRGTGGYGDEAPRQRDGVPEDEAREAFREGTEAALAQRWSEAERAFGRAYALSRAPSALFNQAVALRAMGMHVAARDAFARLLAMDDAQLTHQQRVDAVLLRDESAARVAVLELRGLDAGPHDLLVDGARREDDRVRPMRLELDAGAHHVEVRRVGYEPFAREVALEPGESSTLQVAFTPADTRAAPASARTRRVLWWVGGSVALLLGAAAVTWGVTRDDHEPLEPRAEVVVRVP